MVPSNFCNTTKHTIVLGRDVHIRIGEKPTRYKDQQLGYSTFRRVILHFLSFDIKNSLSKPK